MDGAVHKKEVAQRLRIAFEAVGVSQADLARKFHVSEQSISNWVSALSYPKEYFVKQFCDRYGITADYIYRGVLSGMTSSRADEVSKASEALAGSVEPARPARGKRS